MKTLNQYCCNVPIFMFHGLGIAAAQKQPHIRKSADRFLLIFQQHRNIGRNMI